MTQDEDILWQCGQLGHENAQSLINSLWWLMTQHFGQRGRQEHHPLMLEDLKVIQITMANAITYCPKKEQRPGKVD